MGWREAWQRRQAAARRMLERLVEARHRGDYATSDRIAERLRNQPWPWSVEVGRGWARAKPLAGLEWLEAHAPHAPGLTR